MTNTAKPNAGTAGNTKTAGTQESARELSQSRRYTLAMMNHLGTTETEATRITDALFRVMAEQGDRLHRNVVVCTNCQAEVEAIAWEAMGRLDTVHTETAGQMIEQAHQQSGPFLLELDGRGVKYDRISKGTK